MGILKLIFILLTIILGFCNNALNQNLVVNPGFENYRKNPKLIRMPHVFIAEGYYIPTQGTPDYYHNLHYDSIAYLDLNVFELQAPHRGNACMGIAAISWGGGMEHLTGSLREPLKEDTYYRVSFYIRNLGKPEFYYTSGIGLYFSSGLNVLSSGGISLYQYLFEDRTPSAHVKTDKFISDTAWQKIEKSYLAKGGEKYFTIGVFYEKDKEFFKAIDKYYKIRDNKRKRERHYKKYNQIIKKIGSYGDYNWKNEQCYYLIDDVSVTYDTIKNQK